MADYNLEGMLDKFGVVDVMDAKLYKAVTTTDGEWDNVSTFTADPIAVLDTLTVTNINCEGPIKEIKGGRGGQTLLKYGKTYTFEATDVLGRYGVLTGIFGAQAAGNKNYLTVTDKFAPLMTLVGETQVVDKDTGVRQLIKIVIPYLLPNSIFNLAQQSDGDASTFDLSGMINDFSETAFVADAASTKYSSGGDREYYFFATDIGLAELEKTPYADAFAATVVPVV